MMLPVSILALDIWQGLLKAVELIYCFIKGETPTLRSFQAKNVITHIKMYMHQIDIIMNYGPWFVVFS